MKSEPRHNRIWIAAGFTAGLLLHGVAGWWSPVGFAQGSSNNTITTSTSSSTSFESPPACGLVGSSRTVQTTTLEDTVGPMCIGIGNRDTSNPSPACGGLPAPPTSDPATPTRGTVLLVPAGTSNLNVNVHTQTIQCVAAVPALPWPALAGLVGVVTGLGAWQLARRRRSAA